MLLRKFNGNQYFRSFRIFTTARRACSATVTSSPPPRRTVYAKKFDAGFLANAIRFCFEQGGITIADLQYFFFYDKPLIKLERLLETYVSFSPKGVKSFLAAMPV